MKVKSLKAACLAVGLATAWGGQTDAGVVPPSEEIQLTINPSNNLSHVYFFYATNATGLGSANTLTALPNLTAGVSTTETFFATPAGNYLDPLRFYGVVGLYDETNKLITLSMTSVEAGNVIGTRDFSTEFSGFTEDSLATALLSNDTFTITTFFWEYEAGRATDIPIGTSGQLVNFSLGSDGGSLSATIVPEPSPALLVSAAALAIFAFHRRRLQIPPFEVSGKGLTL
jgi:hypothetical protein